MQLKSYAKRFLVNGKKCTQYLQKSLSPKLTNPELARDTPVQLSEAYIKDHSGDRHADPISHQRTFPDGHVGSHSALASPHLVA